MRFFRTDDETLYESIRLQLDAAWGNPTSDGATITCFDPASNAPHDSVGQVLLAVNDEFCTWEPAATLLPQLVASGAVAEITEAEYQTATRPPLQG
jgi:hypothetical protein